MLSFARKWPKFHSVLSTARLNVSLPLAPNDGLSEPAVINLVLSQRNFSSESPKPVSDSLGRSGNKIYIYHGHRRATENRPSVTGGLFTNRRSRSEPLVDVRRRKTESNDFKPFKTELWDPDSLNMKSRRIQTSDEKNFNAGRRLSAIARYVCESFNKHKKWGPEIVADLKKLHRVTPNVVTEVLKVQNNAQLASKFFHWAGRQKGFRHNFSAYNAFAYCLNRANQYKAADQVVELMKAQGKEPSIKQFEVMIRMHADAGRGLRVHFVFQKMKKFGIKPTVFLYNRILDALVKTEHLDLALEVYEDLKKDGLPPEHITYMILIKGLCRENKMNEVFELLSEMRTRLCNPDVFAYTAMIRSLVAARNLEGAWKIWGEMSKDRVKPDVMSYTTLITGLCKVNEAERAFVLFREMKAKGFLIDRAVYGSIIAIYALNGRVGFAYNLLKEMVKCGYKVDLSMYDSLIEGFCNESRVDKAYKLLQIVIQEGLVPSYFTIKPLVLAFAKTGNIDDMCKLLEQMIQLGRPVKEDIFKLFVFLVCKEEKVTEAVELFEALKEKGYYSVSIFNVLINGLYKTGDIVKALGLFEEMKGGKCKPDVFTYNYVIPCLVDSGNLKEACDLFSQMKERSLVPSVPAYTALVKSLCKIGEINAALSLVQDCLGRVTSAPGVFKYTLTVIYACKSGKADKVVEVLIEMMQQGIPPEDVIYCAVIGGFCKYGSLEDARKVFSSLRNRNLITAAHAAAYDAMLINHMKNTTSELVLCGLKFFGLEHVLEPKVTEG
eukprot:Gb_04675 [translate_table: standard]